MSEGRFQAGLRVLPGLAIIDLAGEVNAAAEEALRSAYTGAEAQDPPVVLLNFRQVGYINSTGIALIVGLLARARTANRALCACALSEHYQEIFQITRLAEYITIYRDEASALAALGMDARSAE